MITDYEAKTLKHPGDIMLVVDDDKINRTILKKIFGDFKVIEAADGGEALKMLRKYKTKISVVLLDIVMPVKDGLQVLREMRDDSVLSEIPVIITSSADENENGLKAIELGAMDYITKPIEPALVKLRVASALQKRENERLRMQNQYLLVQREEELRHQEALQHFAEHDPLTGICNRTAFYVRAQKLITENPDTEFVVVSFDVERFKMINELFGFNEGDRLLCQIAKNLRLHTKPLEVFCRMDGDNFAMCVPSANNRVEEILDNSEKEMKEYTLSFNVKIVLGCYVVEDRSISVEAMLDRAVIAKRSIKGSYQKRCAYYDDTLRQALLQEQEIVNQMEPALKNGQFKMYLQAQYNYATGELVGTEALARWIHPQRGMIAPDVFIPIFERNGFIQRLDEYMWEQACIYIRKWIDLYKRTIPMSISVNISRMDIYNERFCDIIYGLVEKYDIPTNFLLLEITETAYVQNPKQLIGIVEELRAHGFIVEIDDFGSGYSSLNTLKDLHVDVLKLDMKFLEDENKSGRRDSILFHVINMAKSLGLSVIAEGVETKEQADFLLSIGCETMQGYYFARPIPVEDFENYFKS
ncbi:MAG: EAL domain-containing protein [Oscillospiraceae bacterium]